MTDQGALFDLAGYVEPGIDETVRFPLAPVIDQSPWYGSATKLARTLGVDVRTVQRWNQLGLSFWQADELAAVTGIPAPALWPDLWTAAQGVVA